MSALLEARFSGADMLVAVIWSAIPSLNWALWYFRKGRS